MGEGAIEGQASFYEVPSPAPTPGPEKAACAAGEELTHAGFSSHSGPRPVRDRLSVFALPRQA